MAEETKNKSSKKKSLELEASMLNFLCTKHLNDRGHPLPSREQYGERLLPLFPDDEDIVAGIFTRKPLQQVFIVCKDYQDLYNALPTKTTFWDFAEKHQQFQQYLVKAGPDELSDFNRLKSLFFAPITDPEYFKKLSVQVLSRVGIKTQASVIFKEAANVDADPEKLLQDHISRMQTVLDNVRSILYDVGMISDYFREERIDTSVYSATAAVRLSYPGMKFQQDRALQLLAPTKKGKTTLASSEITKLSRRGFNIIYADLENGVTEMDMRLDMIVLEEEFGVACPREALLCNVYPRIDILQEMGYKPFKVKNFYNKGDMTYNLYFEEYLVEVDGIERERYRPCLDLRQAKIGQAQGKNSEQWEILPVLKAVYEQVFQNLEESVNQARSIRRDKGYGEIRILHDPALTTGKLERYFQSWQNDRNDPFFKKDWSTVFVVDWMSRMRSKVKGNKGWEQSRENYSELQRLQTTYRMYSWIIEGVSTPDLMEKIPVSPENIHAMSNRASQYDVASTWLLVSNQRYEKPKRLLHLLPKSNSKGDTGYSAAIFLRFNESYSAIHTISREEHQRVCPEFWAELEESGATEEEVVVDIDFIKEIDMEI